MSGELVPTNPGELLFYQTDDGQTRIQVRVEGETVWLSQRDMAELFQATPQNVTMHIASLYKEAALSDFLLGSRGHGHETLHQLKDFSWK